MPSEENRSAKSGRELFAETRRFANDFPLRSWWQVVSTIGLLATTLALAAVLPFWPARLVAALVGAPLFVRGFIVFHDFMHGSLLRGSRLAKVLLYFYGLIMLTPPRYWRQSHNFHHSHVGKPVTPEPGSLPLMTSDVGSFPLMTTDMWREASLWQRLRYRMSRHPLTFLFAYLTVFLFSICLVPLLKNPRKYWDAGLSILTHGGVFAAVWVFAGFPVLFFAFLLPYAMAATLGAYLFYAQHNYPGMHIVAAEEWSFYRGATESSSYMKLGPIMRWFTGNIGYHHIHHLNPLIPFYRLPEAMAAIPGLQAPDVTTLHPKEVLACLRLNLWDLEKERLVSYREA